MIFFSESLIRKEPSGRAKFEAAACPLFLEETPPSGGDDKGEETEAVEVEAVEANPAEGIPENVEATAPPPGETIPPPELPATAEATELPGSLYFPLK